MLRIGDEKGEREKLHFMHFSELPWIFFSGSEKLGFCPRDINIIFSRLLGRFRRGKSFGKKQIIPLKALFCYPMETYLNARQGNAMLKFDVSGPPTVCSSSSGTRTAPSVWGGTMASTWRPRNQAISSQTLTTTRRKTRGELYIPETRTKRSRASSESETTRRLTNSSTGREQLRINATLHKKNPALSVSDSSWARFIWFQTIFYVKIRGRANIWGSGPTSSPG